jgi:hypothetical protein
VGCPPRVGRQRQRQVQGCRGGTLARPGLVTLSSATQDTALVMIPSMLLLLLLLGGVAKT